MQAGSSRSTLRGSTCGPGVAFPVSRVIPPPRCSFCRMKLWHREAVESLRASAGLWGTQRAAPGHGYRRGRAEVSPMPAGRGHRWLPGFPCSLQRCGTAAERALTRQPPPQPVPRPARPAQGSGQEPGFPRGPVCSFRWVCCSLCSPTARSLPSRAGSSAGSPVPQPCSPGQRPSFPACLLSSATARGDPQLQRWELRSPVPPRRGALSRVCGKVPALTSQACTSVTEGTGSLLGLWWGLFCASSSTPSSWLAVTQMSVVPRSHV